MRYLKTTIVALLTLWHGLPGCTVKRAVIPDQVAAGLTALQQKMNLPQFASAPTASILAENLPAWQKFTIKERELFKPLESNELSEEKLVVDSYRVQLKGIVVIGHQSKAIIAVNDQAYLVNAGQVVTADLILQDIGEDGIDLQRSYKKVYLRVGDKQDI